jgi:hypothetical protein
LKVFFATVDCFDLLKIKMFLPGISLVFMEAKDCGLMFPCIGNMTVKNQSRISSLIQDAKNEPNN